MEEDDEWDRGGVGSESDAGAGDAAPADNGDPGPSASGANANSSKRQREPTLHWADTGFAGYMQAKVRKLEEQHRSNQALQPALSRVFEGVSIHVNGLTVPSHSVSERERAIASGCHCACLIVIVAFRMRLGMRVLQPPLRNATPTCRRRR